MDSIHFRFPLFLVVCRHRLDGADCVCVHIFRFSDAFPSPLPIASTFDNSGEHAHAKQIEFVRKHIFKSGSKVCTMHSMFMCGYISDLGTTEPNCIRIQLNAQHWLVAGQRVVALMCECPSQGIARWMRFFVQSVFSVSDICRPGN